MAAKKDLLRRAHQSALQRAFGARFGELIATFGRSAFRVPRQPIRARGRSDEIFERDGQTDLFVRFELRHVDEHIRRHGRFADAILVIRIGVLAIRRRKIIRGAVEPPEAFEAEKLAFLVEMDVHRARRIARQLAFRDRDAVADRPFLAAHVKEHELDRGELRAKALHERIQPAETPDGVKRRVALRRIAEGDASPALQLPRSPARDLAHDGGMRDDGEPARFILRSARVVLLYPVRFDHHMLAGADKTLRQLERGHRGLDLALQGLRVIVGGLSSHDGNLRGAKFLRRKHEGS